MSATILIILIFKFESKVHEFHLKSLQKLPRKINDLRVIFSKLSP